MTLVGNLPWHNRDAIMPRKPKRILARAFTAQPEVHTRVRWLVLADRVRNVAARLQRTQIESVQPPAPQMVKACSALWISALGNHQQLPPFPAKDNLRETPESLNGAFVPAIGTGVREVYEMSLRWMGGDTGPKSAAESEREIEPVWSCFPSDCQENQSIALLCPGSPSSAVSGL